MKKKYFVTTCRICACLTWHPEDDLKPMTKTEYDEAQERNRKWREEIRRKRTTLKAICSDGD